MSVEQGWADLIRRDLDRATDHFVSAMSRSPEDQRAYIGLARVLILQKRHGEAAPLAQQAMRLGNTPDARLLQAEIIGEQGKRAQAAQAIQAVLQQQPNDGFALALLGEQRLRQGYWDDGATYMTRGLNQDRDGRAFAHVREVVVDMSEAVSVNKIPKQEALKLINKLDYGSDNSSTGFFAMARRALQGGTALKHSAPSAPPAPPSAMPKRASQPQSRPAQQNQSRRQERPSTPSRRSSRSSSASKSPAATQHRDLMGGDLMDVGNDTHLDFRSAVHRDRQLNAGILSGVAQLGRPDWPSEQPNKLDVIASIADPNASSLSASISDYKKDPFRVTNGSLISQIYLDRCMDTMLQRIPVQLAGAIAVLPEEVAQLELNLVDGLLDDFDDIVTVDLQEIEIEDPKVCALGTFLGESVARGYGAVWEYENTPTTSRLMLGGQSFDPFDVARRWLEAKDTDTVILEEFTARVNLAATSTSIDQTVHEYIDLTKGLKGSALSIRLAELWSLYRLKLARTSAAEIARFIDVREEHDDVIIFDIDVKWLPPLQPWMRARGKKSGTSTMSMGYIRETGEFHCMASVKGFARVLSALIDTLNEKSAAKIVEAMRAYHMPGAILITSPNEAEKRSARVGQELKPPSLRVDRSGNGELTLQGVHNRDVLTWRIRYAREAALPWRILPG